MSQTTATPAETLEAATHEDVLSQNGLVLIGTYIKPEDSIALVRTPTGKTQSVSTGDLLGGYTIVAIETGALYMARPDRTRKLTLPDT